MARLEQSRAYLSISTKWLLGQSSERDFAAQRAGIPEKILAQVTDRQSHFLEQDLPGDKRRPGQTHAAPEMPFRERAAGQERAGNIWVKASNLTKDIDQQIKQLRQQGGRDAEKKIDELYRDKYDLKQLGDVQVKAQRTKDGSLEIADRAAVKKQAQGIQRSKQPEKGRGR